MKYCLNYYADNPYLAEVAEIAIKYDKEDLSSINAVLEKFTNSTILVKRQQVEDPTSEEIEFFNQLYARTPRVQVIYRRVPSDLTLEQIHFPWFCARPATDFDTIHYYGTKGASQVYIAEALGFDASMVAKVCKKYNMQVRAFPNVAQASTPGAAAQFFIRPEDVKLYSAYIDSLEFYCPNNIQQESTYYKIYAIQGHWNGNLSEIIKDITIDIDNRNMIPQYGGARLNCKKACLRSSTCRICSIVSDLSKIITKSGLVIRRPKK